MFKIGNRVLSALPSNSYRSIRPLTSGSDMVTSFWPRPSCFSFSKLQPKYLITPYDSQDMKVLVADQFAKQGLQEMENAGIEVTYDAELAGADLAAAIAEVQPEVLVVRST